MCFATIHSLSGTAKLYFHTDPEMADYFVKMFKRGYYVYCNEFYPTSAIIKIDPSWNDTNLAVSYCRECGLL